MDIFPIALTNRDMNTLMQVIEEWGELGVTGSIPDMPEFEDPDDIDAVKARVSQMSSKEMSRFLREFQAELSGSLEVLQKDIVMPGDLGYVEIIRGYREAIAAVHSLRGRVRRPH